MNSVSLNEWPESVAKPALPKDYEWDCLRQASLGNRLWYIRVHWTMRNGKKRMLKMHGEYFTTPQAAVDYAMSEVFRHLSKRAP